MKIQTLRLAAFACAAAIGFSTTARAQEPKGVRTQAGRVQGTVEDGVGVYKGIPFAAPPVGDLRWRAPQPPDPWKGVKPADKFAPACMQVPALLPVFGINPVPLSEDCLYLNVWTPAKSPKDKLPVMVWIYGGGFTSGATQYPLYDGVKLAKKGVVVVSIAYRVGVFGFFADPELTAEQGGHSGDYGLMDQIAGLDWVKHNISAFGGNPGRVTIFGESAGGIAVSMLAASPLAKGLFQGVISESGGNFAPAQKHGEGGENMVSLATAEHNGAALLSRLDVKSIADARHLPAEVLLKAQGPDLGSAWPDFDGYVLLGDQYDLYKAGRYNDTPVLIGTNADEGALFTPTATVSGFEHMVRSGYGEYADKILSVYPANSDSLALHSQRDLFRDTAFAWHTWTWARLQSQTGRSKVFVYYFSHRPNYPDTPGFKDWGAAHGSELAYVFGNFVETMPATGNDEAVSEQISSYWVNFAKTGDPNGAGLPTWPAFTDASQQVMNLDDPSHAIPVPNLDKLTVLDAYYAWRRSQAAASR
ncbi:MAG TPA: carboxylesterase family protein [Candidatus Acidoferrales bacterium]|jgi:para-nitrobenzyl esterase|nr:carboxylesterase family protein [Candidatus Acidoferrales bacterium]